MEDEKAYQIFSHVKSLVAENCEKRKRIDTETKTMEKRLTNNLSNLDNHIRFLGSNLKTLDDDITACNTRLDKLFSSILLHVEMIDSLYVQREKRLLDAEYNAKLKETEDYERTKK
eukprot:TRINITY_DN4785_c0_g1_i2.p1 TRINITY_DN4785_c0_g1~~TRINITY_DN4785_c0_g1_i2.p1  ORF type:complete len:116 (+),score=10.39 TRINITY_DN4785_c0_g1_i2:217-564(+)